jgi:hypothetical protein
VADREHHLFGEFQTSDLRIDIACLTSRYLSGGRSIGRVVMKNERDVVEGKSSKLTEHDHHQSGDARRVVSPLTTDAHDGFEQTSLFVVPQRRRRDPSC